VPRRPDPERIRQAHRVGTLQRLIGEGELPAEAERLVAAWEANSVGTGYGPDAWAWIEAQRARPGSQAVTLAEVSGSLQPPPARDG
jgi:hypothetical protein